MSGRARPRRPRTGGRGGREPRARIQAREHEAWSLAIIGHTQRAISERLGISQAAVCKILQRVATRLEMQVAHAAAHERALRSARLTRLARELWEGWTRSQRDSTRKHQRRIEPTREGQPPRQITELTVESRAGDPRFLRELKDLLLAPLAPGGATQPDAPARSVDLGDLTEAELTVLQRLMERQRAQATATDRSTGGG